MANLIKAGNIYFIVLLDSPKMVGLGKRPEIKIDIEDNIKWDSSKGTKPVPEPSSVPKVILMMVLHVCRKIVFIDTKLKVSLYLASLFVISLLADVLPFPTTYFAHKENVFNQYFVKIAWGWTLVMTIPFVSLTALTYCCGKKDKVLKHLIRLWVATASWFFWVRLFSYIESTVGRCNVKGEMFQTKSVCLHKGLFWQGFDISGHAFILIYSSLVLIEEARAIVGWEGIQDLIRNEDHSRAIGSKDQTSNPLRNLSQSDFDTLKFCYEKYTPYIRCLFIGITFLVIMWDFMLLSTMLYFHSMVEKFISGCIAVCMWYITYCFWYRLPNRLPDMPGEGLFKYNTTPLEKQVPINRKSNTLTNKKLPTFMGMPLYGLGQENRQERSEKTSQETGMSISNTI